MAKIERLDLERMALGEGPHWDAKSQSLLVVDINGPKVFRYSPLTNRTISISFGSDPIGFIVPVNGQNDHFIVGEKLSLTLVHWDTENNKIVSKDVLATLPEPRTNRINDGKADASGRIWFGTMTDGAEIVPGAGSFYSYTKQEGLRKHQENITISNGIAITADNKIFHYIDSMKHRVDAYDFDIKHGKLGISKVIFDFKKKNMPGSPDGMTIDANGNLWVACFDGRQVIQINPANGDLLQSVEFPNARQITSVVFGGPNLDELYVTSAEIKVSAEEKGTFTESGSVYRVTGLQAKGLPAENFDLSV